MIATYTSRCACCDEPILVGDEIVVTDDEYCHAECVGDYLDEEEDE